MQQLNLYKASLRKKADPFSVNRIAIYSGALLAFMAVISLVQWGVYAGNHNELEQTKAKHQALLISIQKLTSDLTARKGDQSLQDRLAKKEAELLNKQNVLKVLSGQRFGNTKGFADYFTGLARQRVEGLWVTGLHIHSGGEKINLQGGTLKPELVPHYLQKLSKEPIFEEIEFQTFLMERPEKSSHIDFYLHSNKKEAG